MKYQPNIYAKALVGAASEVPKERHGEIVSRFAALLQKNGDVGQADKILRLAEKMMLKNLGRRVLSVESARPLGNIKELLFGLIREGDVIEEKTDPSLVAGIKITVDGERQFDGTLKRKMEKMFL